MPPCFRTATLDQRGGHVRTREGEGRNTEGARRPALRCCGGTPRPHRVVRIRDTLSLYEIQVSEALYDSIKDQPDIEYVCGPVDLCFDGEGFLLD